MDPATVNCSCPVKHHTILYLSLSRCRRSPEKSEVAGVLEVSPELLGVHDGNLSTRYMFGIRFSSLLSCLKPYVKNHNNSILPCLTKRKTCNVRKEPSVCF
ncbi:hypothetical protein HanRHA438_Chr08g0358771 [Helianthus annuus]|nr:hypothetical protein HanRHA438_Chr08g0358771 [Helianthus annuus]